MLESATPVPTLAPPSRPSPCLTPPPPPKPAAPVPSGRNARRIVVKIGSALLADRDTGTLKAEWLASLVADVAELVREGRDVVLVSSGSIALGRHKLGLPKGPLALEQSQAAAAVGQISLAHAYQELAAKSGLTVAQILLTLGDTEERRRYLNARHTIETLLGLKAIPVVNENDTVATAEIKYGDNDRLSARVAGMVSADCLVLLSDVDGLYTAPPNDDPNARHIPLVTEITGEIEAMAGDAGTELSKGGMKTKVQAGRIALGAGTNMVITTGKVLHPLRAISEGCKVTWFLAKQDPVTARKRWIAGQLEARGTSSHRRRRGKGARRRQEPARGGRAPGGRHLRARRRGGDPRSRTVASSGGDSSSYAHGEAALILGRKSSEIAEILGFEGGPELIHRNDMALHRK